VSLLTVSGNGCLFENLLFFNEGDAATAINNVIVTGERNVFNKVHIGGPFHATVGAVATWRALKVTGSENLFDKCTIGSDTILRAATNYQLELSGGASRNIFENCLFLSSTDANTRELVLISSGLSGFTMFDNCTFFNFWINFGGTLLQCATQTVGTTHYTILRNPSFIGILEWDATDAAGTYVVGPAVGAGAGIAVTPTT
jgi:hypothetical protein